MKSFYLFFPFNLTHDILEKFVPTGGRTRRWCTTMIILWFLIMSRWFFSMTMMIMVLLFDFVATWIFWSAAAHHDPFSWWFSGRTSTPWTAVSFFTLTPVTHLYSLWQFTIIIATIPVIRIQNLNFTSFSY